MTIYSIRNLIDGKMYVGQTTKSIEHRWRAHCSYSSTCRYLRRAIELYGPECFVIEPIATAFDRDELNRLEEFFIRYFNTLAPNGYNLIEGGTSRIASEETRRKMSETRMGVPLINRRGKPAWNKGLKTGPQSKEQVEHRVRAATEAKLKPIKCLQTGEVFPSVKEASRKLKLHQGNISMVLTGKRRFVGGLTFIFLRDAA